MYPQEQRDNLFEESKHEYAVGSIVFAVVNTYRTDAFPTGEHPKNWTEFFDPDLFPGPRTLYASSGIPSHTLEHALMADGVAMDELYPLDVDRAFAVLDKVKPHVVKWWDSGAIPVQMLADNEVVLATAYNGRAQALIDEGVPIAIEWNGGTMNQDFWFIVKNSPNPENAQKFVQFATQGDVQGEFAKHYAYGPANALAYEYLSEERAAVLPTNPDLVAKMMFRNEDWWAENREAMVERFAEWLLE
jgi:putative spermidine/putrescine transport system substrate-binding protein